MSAVIVDDADAMRERSRVTASADALPLDVERLFKLRVVVARVGELDVARWWNSSGQLARLAAAGVGRGLPRTHWFGRARSVIAIASEVCRETFDQPGAFTLFRLPASIEDELDAHWERWLDRPEHWRAFGAAVEEVRDPDVGAALRNLGLVEEPTLTAAAALRRTSDNRAVALPGAFVASDDRIALLAAAFGRGEVGALAVPFARAGDA